MKHGKAVVTVISVGWPVNQIHNVNTLYLYYLKRSTSQLGFGMPTSMSSDAGGRQSQ